MPPLSWRELTERNTQVLRDILKSVPAGEQRLRMMEIAAGMISQQVFENATARWNAFHNALGMVVAATFD